MRADVRTVLACPDCRSRLVDNGAALVCEGCGRPYEQKGDVPLLLPRESLGEAWMRKQELGEQEYDGAMDETAIEVARRFSTFAAVEGLVLDVGCGVEPLPVYLEGRDPVGVDPILGTQPRDFPFVQGVAERLPFADASFGGAISATMLDHVAEPAEVLLEIRRVLRPGGRLAVWVGVVDEADLRENALGPLALPERRALPELLRRHGVVGVVARAVRHLFWNRARTAVTTLRLRFARRRVVAKVYADRGRYHFRFFEADDVLELLRQTHFRVLATERVDTPGSGASLFVLAQPESPR
jgi:SAM-dependent methyltransferase